jgi:hypothetical protein
VVDLRAWQHRLVLVEVHLVDAAAH